MADRFQSRLEPKWGGHSLTSWWLSKFSRLLMLLLPSHGLKFSRPYAGTPLMNQRPWPWVSLPGSHKESGFVPRTLLHTEAGLWQACYLKMLQVLRTKGHYLRISLQCFRKPLLVVCGVLQDSRWGQRAQGIPNLGNILGILTPWDSVLWLGKGAKGSIYNGDIFF